MKQSRRQSHTRTQDIRRKPNVGENPLLQFVSIFFLIRNFSLQCFILVQSLPVRRLQPAESYKTLSHSPGSSWKGATTPFSLALAKILVRRCWPTEGYNLLFLLGTTFHKFSDWIHTHQSFIKISVIPKTPFQPNKQIITSLKAVPRTQ